MSHPVDFETRAVRRYASNTFRIRSYYRTTYEKVNWLKLLLGCLNSSAGGWDGKAIVCDRTKFVEPFTDA